MDPETVELWNNIQDAVFIQRRLAGTLRVDVKRTTYLSTQYGRYEAIW